MKNKRYDIEAIRRAYEAGEFPSNVALAKSFGCSESAVRGWAKKHGWVWHGSQSPCEIVVIVPRGVQVRIVTRNE